MNSYHHYNYNNYHYYFNIIYPRDDDFPCHFHHHNLIMFYVYNVCVSNVCLLSSELQPHWAQRPPSSCLSTYHSSHKVFLCLGRLNGAWYHGIRGVRPVQVYMQNPSVIYHFMHHHGCINSDISFCVSSWRSFA